MIISISSMKGGCGKSTTTILLANCLAARGKSILIVDFDTNNSVTNYYTTGIQNAQETCMEHNLFIALNKNDCTNEIIQTNVKGIKLIPSSVRLDDLRAIEYRRFSKIIKAVEDNFDFIILDTPPTYSNHTMSAIYAADTILTPLFLDTFNYTTACYLEEKMHDELSEKCDNWYFIYTAWETQWEEFPNSTQSQWDKIFESKFENIIDIKIPGTKLAKNYISTGIKLDINSKYSAGSKKLAIAFNELANALCGFDKNDTTQYAEVF